MPASPAVWERAQETCISVNNLHDCDEVFLDNRIQPGTDAQLSRIASVAAGLAIMLAVLGLAGHALAIPSLYSLHAGLQAMSLLTSAGLSAVGVAAICRMQKKALPALLCSALGATLGAAALATHIVVGHDAISPMVAHAFNLDSVASGQTSISTAISILALSLATNPLLEIRRHLSDMLAGTAVLIAILALSGYAYSSADLYALPFFHNMALNTAIAILLLSCAIILGRPDTGWGAIIGAPGEVGRATRRQLLCLLIPPVMGWLLVQAANADYLRLGSAMALLVVLSVAPLLWLILRDGRALAALDQEREIRTAMEQDQRQTLEQRLADQAAELGERSQQRLLLVEQAQAKSEGRYRSLFDSIDAGFCVVEMRFAADGTAEDYRFVELNKAFEAYTGLHGAAGQWMRTLGPSHKQQWFDRCAAVARSGRAVRFDYAAEQLGGGHYDVYAFPVDDPAVHRVGILFNDVSARKSAEDELRTINESLEQRVADAVAEREYAQTALRQSQKMEAMGQLTGGVAHDFNNLLTPIVGSLDLLARRGALTDRERRLVTGAQQSAERARLLVQRLLAFARRQPLQAGPVDVVALISGMAGLIASTAGPQIRVIVETSAGLPPALADANQLEMAILNLCVNARDAMPDGGILTIAASAEAKPVDGHLALPDTEYLRLTIADTGVGMDEETSKRAIEPFYSTKGVGKGTGLGLSMVHGLAAQLNGTLEIRSRPDFGTRVDLWLPISDEVAVEKKACTPPSPGDHRGRALVVDDEVLVRLATADMLQDLGYETVEAGSAREAHALLLDGAAFDVVVTDHLMPGMTGAELAMEIRRQRPHLPVLLVSGYAEVEAVAPGIPRLSKPFRQDELGSALSELITVY